MDRRDIVKSALAAGAALAGTALGSRAEAAQPPAAGIPRVVYHLCDVDKSAFVLGNVRNHIEGMGGPDHVAVAVVVHGPALRSFRAADHNDAIAPAFASLRTEGVAFHACIHTMEGMKLTLDDLLPGFVVAEKGGVVKLAQLQAEGWLYLRP
jgi:intracellular sulfur oxidation DsrE/DsrF family protein